MPATDPEFYERVWQLEASTLDADLVLLAFFVGNDFRLGLLRELRDDPESPLARHSIVYRMIRNVVTILSADLEAVADNSPDHNKDRDLEPGFELEGWPAHYARRPGRLSAKALLRIMTDRSKIADLSRRKQFDVMFHPTVGVLRSTVEEITESGARCLIVIIPARFQVNAEDQRRILEGLNASAEIFDWGLPQRLLRTYFEKHGIAYLDLLPGSLEEAEHSSLYRDGDTHWSIAGSTFAAESILDHFRRHPELVSGKD
jgi:hypothetical protein